MLALIAALTWLANPAGFKLIYLARPDMLVVAFLIGAWACGTVALAGEQSKRRRLTTAALFWACIAGAALAKGPLALFPLIYVVLAAKLIYGRWSVLGRLGWAWGLPIMIAVVAAWVVPAWMRNPTYFSESLLEGELRKQTSVREPLELLRSFWKPAFYYFTRFAPWSFIAVLALAHIRPRRWFRHPMAPAVLWLFLTLAVLSFLPSRSDRVAPVYPAAAVLAAYWLVVEGPRFRLTPAVVAASALAIVIGLAMFDAFASPAATTRHGENVKAFARQVRRLADDDDIVFISAARTPLMPLLGRSQPQNPTPEQVAAATWVVRPYQEGDDKAGENTPAPAVISEPIAEVDRSKPGRLALYGPRRGRRDDR
jgi:4-amino-4-deoxy-L-arabinose transferase-like glycosyltransferase